MQPLDRLMVLLSVAVLSHGLFGEVITNTKKNLQRDVRVLERLRLLQASFFTTEEAMPVVRNFIPKDPSQIVEGEINERREEETESEKQSGGDDQEEDQDPGKKSTRKKDGSNSKFQKAGDLQLNSQEQE